ncbi:MAG: ABC transporter permease [Duncaniella sp.]|nr:ABC transporter permease [Duncaniella sp.]
MKWFVNLFRVFRREMWRVFTDVGVLIFFFGLPLAYPVVYTLIYNPEVVTEIPTVIVDHSRTAESRDLVRAIGSTQAVKVIGYAADLAEAKRAWAEKKCYGVVEIPADYASRIGTGKPVNVDFYSDVSLLLRYRQYLFALTGVQIDKVQQITAERITTLAGGAETMVSGLPVNTQSNLMGDTSQGFASFVMPGVFILILQQSMILGVCCLAGTANDRRRFRRQGRADVPIPGDDYSGAGPVTVVLGKTLCYVVIYLPLAYFILTIVPEVFSLPHVQSASQYMPFVFPVLVASALLAQTLQVFVRERESCFPLIVFTSVVFLFMSGLTWPRYAFNQFQLFIADLVPATWGVNGFIRITSDGSTLSNVAGFYRPLWYLSAGYFITAVLLRGYVFRKKA